MNYNFFKDNYIKIIIFLSISISSLQIVFIPGIIAPLIFDLLVEENTELIKKLSKKSSKVCNQKKFFEKEFKDQSIIGIICKSLKI